jgi:hypothetical protein
VVSQERSVLLDQNQSGKKCVEAVPLGTSGPDMERNKNHQLVWIHLGGCAHYLKSSEKIL